MGRSTTLTLTVPVDTPNQVSIDTSGYIKIVLCDCDCQSCDHKLTNDRAVELLSGKNVVVYVRDENGDHQHYKPN